mmetsp:Transcript_130718/g.279543  ORF Transcript_130718/g.279543 Transcript_130718/m.279543 type:complete len:384 (+) Transcript_130718:39-1190(+)
MEDLWDAATPLLVSAFEDDEPDHYRGPSRRSRFASGYSRAPIYDETAQSSSRRASSAKAASGCLWCTNCLLTVPQDEWYAIEHFGRLDRILPPGLAFVGLDVCGCCVQVRSISNRVIQTETVVQTKSKDHVFVTLRVAVQRSADPEFLVDAFYRFADMEWQVRSLLSNIVRSQIPQFDLDEVFEQIPSIASELERQLSRELEGCGFRIHKVLITEAMPDQEVVQSMNDVQNARLARAASILNAEAKAIVTVTGASAQAEVAHLQGQGQARRRGAILAGLRDVFEHPRQDQAPPDITTKALLDLLLITESFETLKKIAASSKAQAIFIPRAKSRRGALTQSAPAQVEMAAPQTGARRVRFPRLGKSAAKADGASPRPGSGERSS